LFRLGAPSFADSIKAGLSDIGSILRILSFHIIVPAKSTKKVQKKYREHGAIKDVGRRW
jgi:hypothetical protein